MRPTQNELCRSQSWRLAEFVAAGLHRPLEQKQASGHGGRRRRREAHRGLEGRPAPGPLLSLPLWERRKGKGTALRGSFGLVSCGQLP